jgi:hypothetical protein
MCTVVILRRPGHDWPLILGANRDEMRDRPWKPPARHWPDRPDVIAGMDELAGGSWMGLNDQGVVAAILNRRGSLGPAEGKRTRGELVLDALDHADAADAAKAFEALAGDSYRPFNMVIADDRDAFWLKSLGTGRVQVEKLPPGVSMVTAYDRNDMTSARIAVNLPQFEAASPPDPDRGDWKDWETLLASRTGDGEARMNVALPSGFGTSSSSLLALPDRSRESERHAIWRFAAGAPDSHPYNLVKTR